MCSLVFEPKEIFIAENVTDGFISKCQARLAPTELIGSSLKFH
jgi:hypothetical protein